MKLRLTTAALAACLATLSSLPAHAGVIHMNFTGTVTGYSSLAILQDDFPLGTAISMALTYDDSFVGLPTSQLYLGMAPAISGTMTLGGKVYTMQTMRLSYYSYGATPDDPPPAYGFHVAGIGPDTDDGEVFSGIGLHFGTGWLGSPYVIGFGNTNWAVANNGYLTMSGTTTHQQVANPVPAPATLGLVLAGLGLCGLVRPVRRAA